MSILTEFQYYKPSKIIEGGANGADKQAKLVAERLGIEVIEIKAEWNKYGKRAGPIRNEKMAQLKPDLVLAFHDNITTSLGTYNMISIAKRYGIPIKLIQK